ncbi:alpha/beta hydrolase [Thalassobaculum fulvum]|uniref:Alpha/beta hydrolase n=1 Tax=Thalassobaculum fulvum TaxID=1633335 RepID=A0A918XPH0_9PROT|nr:alpha/beta fold hydrolase [Thalassobaculum fulvum]GHD44493.1 alpha/beta hydrolase [Thalassobaculum fulvum]
MRPDRTPLPVLLAVLLSLVLGACAPMAIAPGPDGRRPWLVDDHAALMADGTRLPLRVWRPDGEAVAAIVALHGFGDYSNAFAELGPTLAKAGVAVFAADQRGFGRAGSWGRWHGAAAMVADARALADLLRAEFPGRPVYLMGESMGGAVALLAMAGDGSGSGPAADGAILSAPAVWGRDWMPFYQVWGLELAGHTVPWLPLNPRGLPFKPSDNIAMLRRLSRDPLFVKNPRVDAVYGLVDLMDAAQAAGPAVRGPLLVLYGDRDDLVPKKPTCAVLAKLRARPVGAGGMRVVLYPNGHHMLFRDLDGARVVADIAAWARNPAGPLPSGDERAPDGAWLERFCNGAGRPDGS